MPNTTARSAPTPSTLWAEGLKTLGISLVLALGVRTAVAEPRYVPTGSMEPTIHVNDRIVIDKISYHFSEPHRGDIVMFSPPDILLQQSMHDDLIKRVIGLPGDKVEVKDGRVYVNDRPLRETYIMAPPEYRWGPDVVPPNSYLVLGDNRNDSYDSHFWGFVPRDHILGRAIFRFWPFQRVGPMN
jgi:signal peptidase I